MNFNWNELDNTLNVVEQLQATNSNKDKIAILEANKDDEMLQRVLNYTYDSFKKYGITESVYDSVTIVGNPIIYGDPFHMLDCLAQNNINDVLRELIKQYIEENTPDEYKELVKGMLFKDLKIGVNAKTINKVWDGLVPLFEVQLAESFGKKTIPTDKKFYVTTKLDGFRILAVPNELGEYIFYTRKGEVYEGLDHLQQECQLIGQGRYVLDGELIARNDDNLLSGDLYKVTTKIARKKGKTPDKAKLQFHCFDIVKVDEFKRGKSSDTYAMRRQFLDVLFEEHKLDLRDLVKVPVLYQGTDQSEVSKIAKELTDSGYEGAMVNIGDAYYECKRHAGVLKVKSFKDADVWVKGVYEGTGRNKGRLGGIVIQYLYNGELQECECGSGFTDEHRIKFWDNPELITGRVIEIQYFEVTTNDKGGYGLRFPSWHHRFRDDKTQQDITDVALQ
jgi:DNA ligase-1